MYRPYTLPESLPAETVREPWRQVLLDAADTLRRDGWCKVYFTDERGRHCVNGAIESVGTLEAQSGAKEQLARFVGAKAAYPHVTDISACCALMFWNDDFGNGDKVITALEGAARSALRDGGK